MVEMIDTHTVRLFDAVESYQRISNFFRAAFIIAAISVFTVASAIASLTLDYRANEIASNFISRNTVPVTLISSALFIAISAMIVGWLMSMLQTRKTIIFRVRVTSKALDSIVSTVTDSVSIINSDEIERTLWNIKIGQARLALQDAQRVLSRVHLIFE